MGSDIQLTRHPSGQFLLSTVLPDGFVLREAFPKGTVLPDAYSHFCKLMCLSMQPL